MLMAAEEFAQDTFTPVAHYSSAHGARCGDTQPGRPKVVTLASPEQKPPRVETLSALAGDIKIGAAPYALRRLETEADLLGIRQR